MVVKKAHTIEGNEARLLSVRAFNGAVKNCFSFWLISFKKTGPQDSYVLKYNN